MRRRVVLAILGAAGFATRAFPQPRAKRRIAIMHVGDTDEVVRENGSRAWNAFFSELRKRGFVEGENFIVDRLAVESGFWRGVPEELKALLKRAPEVIVAESSVWVRGLSAMEPNTPIVAIVTDPLGEDISASLARPARNITGVATDTGAALLGKHLELLLDAAPNSRNITCLGASWPNSGMRSLWQDASRRGVSVHEFLVYTQFRKGTPEERYVRTFEAMLQEGADAVLVFADPEHFRHASVIATTALSHKVPLLSPFRSVTEAGGLLSYGADWDEMERRRAEYVARILNGEKAQDLPLQQPAKLNLLINLKTAAALNLTIPPTLLARADEVIE